MNKHYFATCILKLNNNQSCMLQQTLNLWMRLLFDEYPEIKMKHKIHTYILKISKI